jgi:hypothetical protein
MSVDHHWLRNDHLEAAFSTESGMRLAVLRQPGKANVLREDDGPCRGLKTWVMMPSDVAAFRDMLSEEAADVRSHEGTKLRMESKAPNRWGLVLEWIAGLEDSAPEMQVIQRIHNRGQETLYLGIWSIAAFSEDTRLRIPFARSDSLLADHPNQIAVFPYTNMGDSRIHSTPDFLQVKIRKGSEGQSIKLGLVQSEGRVLALGSDTVMEMSAPYHADALYPEGGMNVSVYASPADPAGIFGEAEVMGPLQLLEPGESVALSLRIRLAE